MHELRTLSLHNRRQVSSSISRNGKTPAPDRSKIADVASFQRALPRAKNILGAPVGSRRGDQVPSSIKAVAGFELRILGGDRSVRAAFYTIAMGRFRGLDSGLVRAY